MNSRFFVSLFKSKRHLRATWLYVYAKRTLDIVIASILLSLLLPFMILVAVAIRYDSEGPAFFRQIRHGHTGKTFRLYKFRTMYNNACDDGRLQASDDDERITAIGHYLRRLMIDELPQLINILKGEMSLVGPRPHPVPLDQFYAQHLPRYWQRYQCKPGLTGLAQIKGHRGATPMMEHMAARLSHDLYYIRRQSLWLDIKILFSTLRLVF